MLCELNTFNLIYNLSEIYGLNFTFIISFYSGELNKFSLIHFIKFIIFLLQKSFALKVTFC